MIRFNFINLQGEEVNVSEWKRPVNGFTQHLDYSKFHKKLVKSLFVQNYIFYHFSLYTFYHKIKNKKEMKTTYKDNQSFKSDKMKIKLFSQENEENG